MDGVRRKRSIALWLAVALLAVNVVLVAVEPGLALPRSKWDDFFGPKLVRAEIVTKERGEIHDYRVDRGRVVRVAPGTVTLAELDGTVAAIPIAPNAIITVKGKLVPLASLRRNMIATTIRDGDGPAQTVEVGKK